MPTSPTQWRARRVVRLIAASVAVATSVATAVPSATAAAAPVRPSIFDSASVISAPASAMQPAKRLALDASKPIFPMQTTPYCYASDSFGDGRSGGRAHQGIDIGADRVMGPTQAVYAVVDGTLAGQVLAGASNAQLSGNTWGLKSKSGTVYYVFMHLSRFADGLSNGSAVTQGQIIGYVGDTGNPGPGNYHLHFEIHPAGARTAAVDPLPILPIPPECRR